MIEWMQLYLDALVVLLGLCFGSFLNVCICRIPEEKSVVHPPSACPGCGARIRWYDNLPILSWLILRGRCRGCRQSISIQYPVMELLTAVLFFALWRVHGLCWTTPIYALAVFGLMLATVIDLREFWLPDRVSIGGMILFPLLSLLVPQLHGAETAWTGIRSSLLGLGIGFGLFWMIREAGTAALKQEAMGFGDVKLMGMLGALLGWQSILFITFISALIGSVVGVSLILLHRRELQSRIPFGPYLAGAALIWMLGGDRLWFWYTTWWMS